MSDNNETADLVVQRQAESLSGSKQPRFSDDQDFRQHFFNSIMGFSLCIDEVPPYIPRSRTRDQFLSSVWRKEDHLAGVVNSVVAIDKNRGWNLTGGRNQVRFFEEVLRSAENGKGWRYWNSMASESFWTTDINSITETERERIPGRLLNIFHVDPTRCELLGGLDNELAYWPSAGGGRQVWKEIEHTEFPNGRVIDTPADYFRVASLPNVREEYNGLGFCAVSRCIELVRLMVGVTGYNQEKLGARMPQGLLLLHNIDQTQWEEALEARSDKLDGLERKWFGAVAVLASAGIDQIDAKLVALSELPENFDQRLFTDMIMFAYALCFGYDPTEFWPVNAGIMGRGRETEIQHRKATGKGGLDFALSLQDQLQNQFPNTLHFGIEQRDVEGEILDAELNQLYVEMITRLYTAVPDIEGGEPLVSRDQALSMLATHTSLVPKAWTVIEELTHASDTDSSETRMRLLREEYRELPSITRCAEIFPAEPIDHYVWPKNRTITLWQRGDDIYRPINYRGVDIKYRSGTLQITSGDVEKALAT